MTILDGIFAALLTPFAADESIDRQAIAGLVEFQVGQGIDGLYVGGSSGEAMMQSREERAGFLTDVAAANQGRLKLIAHVGAIATADALALADVAEQAGYQAISAIPPFYYDFSRAEVLAHYFEIVERSALPLIVYNFPARTSGFTFAELGQLLGHERIVGVKHTSSDMFQLERIRRQHPQALVYNGYDEMCLAGLAMGAHGAIGTTFNYMGDLFVQLRADFAAGRLDEARGLQAMANVLIEALIEVGVLPGSRTVLELMGVQVGQCRRPFRRTIAADATRLREALAPILRWREDRR